MRRLNFSVSGPDLEGPNVELRVRVDDEGDFVVQAVCGDLENDLFELRADGGDLNMFVLDNDFRKLFSTDENGFLTVVK